jgi:TonB-linked SusC/RagA family outer membrane protein
MSKTFQKSFLLIFAVLIFFSSSVFSQQTIRVSGKITDGTNNTPLNGVSIVVKGSAGTGTTTDSLGNYSLQVPSNATLVISSVGFERKEIAVNNRNVINTTLNADNSSLDDVVVIGYGSRQKKDLTGSVAAIRPREIEKSSALSPELAMQGQMAGVQITQTSGDPTARLTVRIRGTNTFAPNGAADPLYVIDGIPIIEGGQGVTPDPVNDPTRRGGINLYTIINPNDIESMTVLKDASAAAVYGVRAANGVVLITTKSGRGSRIRVDFDGTYGWVNIPKTYDVLNTQQYVKFYTDAYNANPDLTANNPIPIQNATEFGALWNPANSNYIGNNATYDWQNEIRNKNAPLQNYNVRASGSNGGTSYNFSLGYADQENAFFGSRIKRYSVSTNIISKIGKYLEVGLNLRGVQQKRESAGGDNLNVWQAAPWQKIYDPSGPYGYAPLWKLNAPITPSTFNASTLYGRQYVAYQNVFGASKTGGSTQRNQTAFGTVYLQVNPVNGLKIKGSASGQQIGLHNENFTNFDAWYFQENPSNPYTNVPNVQPGTRPIALSFANSDAVSLTYALNADYVKSFGEHNINITADMSKQEYTWSVSGANGYTTTEDPDIRFFSPTGFERGYNETRDRYTLLGYLGRVSYNYANKYYVDGVIRYDGSSKFAPGYQFGAFPSGAVAWRISQENFMKNLAFVNDLKLRASYGLLGNQTTRGWQYISVASASPPNYNFGSPNSNNVGISYTNYPNATLTWEKVQSLTVGMDATIFNNFNITFDYYRKITKGIIQQILLAPSTGILLETDANIADVLNNGIELTVGYNRRFGKFGLNVSANITTQHNEVLKLANNNFALRGETAIEVGFPIGYLNGYKTDGIFQSQKEVDDYNSLIDDRTSGRNAPGDIRFQDLYGAPKQGSTVRNLTKDGIVNTDDQTYLGKTIPGYFGGFTIGMDYRGFDLSALFTYRGDVQKYNRVRVSGEGMNGFGRNQFASVLDAWTPQHTTTSMPRAVYRDPNANLRYSDRFVEDAGYLRLQNLQLGYNVPAELLQKTKVIQSLRVFLTGINLFTITPYSGLDPEGDDLYPATRQILIGVKASF